MTQEAVRTEIDLGSGLFRRIATLFMAQPLLAPRIAQIEQMYALLRDQDEIELFVDLLLRAACYHGQELEAAAKRLANHVTEVWNLSPAQTCFVAKDLEDKASSADAALQIFKTALAAQSPDWSGKNFVGRMKQAVKPGTWDNIVLIDDFIGTGNKVAKKVSWLRARDPAVPRAIYIATFAAQSASLKVLDPIVTGFHADLFLDRAISDHYEGDDKEKFLSAIDRIEHRFANISPDVLRGFAASESIYFPLLWNTPNNVFPMFWFNNHPHDANFKPILVRTAKT